jgi:hypothetical protein
VEVQHVDDADAPVSGTAANTNCGALTDSAPPFTTRTRPLPLMEIGCPAE